MYRQWEHCIKDIFHSYNRARQENEHLIVSIFVNPTQFLEGEDLDAYPRKEEADTKICKLAGVDILFMPTIDAMYEDDELRISAPAIRGYILEGEKRPGHFDGMLQVVMKLLNLSGATQCLFWEKRCTAAWHLSHRW